ncbi:Outer membrane protein A [Ralstonia edaphis]|uniref:OmpA family protein n=1 Tax=Ralstonia edaphi TaxID=3058599 RepID=UPI0028F62D70|nr:OmpA family protein [Ralstonia sp. LMG 6871]CAJ0720887.1 Outer membrane protein A [Ralstonia sp. LMG 6871]
MTINETNDSNSNSESAERVTTKGLDLERIEKILKLAAKFVPAFGIFLVFFYCSSINFYPSGLTIGDTLFFAFSIIGFGLIYGFAFGCSIYCAANVYGFFSRVFSCKSWRAFIVAVRGRSYRIIFGKFGTLFSVTLPIAVSGFFLVFLCFLINDADYGWSFLSLLGLLSIGFCIWVVTIKRREAFQESPWMAFLLVISLAFMPLLLVPHLANTVTITAMRLAGVRVERALVDLPQSEYARVLATVNRAAVVAPPCRKYMKDRCLMRADVLFQGVGQRVQIRLPIGGAPKDKNGNLTKPEAFVTLQQSDIKISSINPFTYGADVNSDATFDFDSATLTTDGRSKLDEIVKELKDYTILSLAVTGHTDRLGSDKHNLELSQLRAQAAANYLAPRLRTMLPNSVHTHGVGSSVPRLGQDSCPGHDASDALRRCLAEDRYVEVDVVAKRSR